MATYNTVNAFNIGDQVVEIGPNGPVRRSKRMNNDGEMGPGDCPRCSRDTVRATNGFGSLYWKCASMTCSGYRLWNKQNKVAT